MKKTAMLSAVLVLLLFGLGREVHAEDAENAEDAGNAENAHSVTFSQGFSAAWFTRIIYQEGRSNFVFRDFLPGIYFGAELRSLRFVVPVARLTICYPFTSTFNHVIQTPSTPLHLGADLQLGARFETNGSGRVSLNVGPNAHIFFLTSERWNYLNLGASLTAGAGFSLTPRWTLLADAGAAVFNGNLGGNRHMEPFDVAYRYHVTFGFRYSRRAANSEDGSQPIL